VTFGTIFTNPELLTPLIRELTAKGHGVRVALAAGIPLVLIPQGADQGGQAESVARTGAAITIAAEAFSPRAVALAVADVLEQPSYRATARRIAPDRDDALGRRRGRAAGAGCTPRFAVKPGSPPRVSSGWDIEAHGAGEVYSTDATTRASHTACR
jgi:hypothetical protein